MAKCFCATAGLAQGVELLMANVILPAHNEAGVIERCIDSVINQEGVDRIIVACNGCTDNTAQLVREKYPHVICLDIEKPSKTNALNEAEKHVVSYPVFYIDADTVLAPGSVRTIVGGMKREGLLLAAPTPVVDTSSSCWAVRQYYRIWLNLPYIRDGVIGTCSFVLSREGRKRFRQFPDIINDDGYVRCCFDSRERANITGSEILITAPGDLYSLIKIKTRARLGNMQLEALKLCARPKQADYSGSMKDRLLSREFLPVTVYMIIALIIRLRAWKQFRKLDSYVWEKDMTSRP